MRGSWRPNKDCNMLTQTRMAITAFLSRSPGPLKRGPGGPASPGTCSDSSIFSPTPSAQSEVLRAPSAGFWFSLQHLISNWSELQLLNRGSWGTPLLSADSLYSILSPTNWNFLCTELYYCFTPTQFTLSTVKLIPSILNRIHLLLTQVPFLFWQIARVGGQYTTFLSGVI